ncbi:MAG: hypothetical protein KDD02_14520 [Phaeodactylibacter sp.]|nr:hypothetical protein [Phaeodactylibacter sp.]MCB9302664.1 hypothetical protein [Lewinellaceae bacterium]
MKTRSYSEVCFSVRMIIRMIFSTQIALVRKQAPVSEVNHTIGQMLAEFACSLVELGAENHIVQLNPQLRLIAREVTGIINFHYPEIEQTNNRLARSTQPYSELRACMELTLVSVSEKVAFKVFRLLKDFYEEGIIPGEAERMDFGAGRLFNLPNNLN